MRNFYAGSALFLSVIISSAASAVVTMDWTLVGNPGNPPDTQVMDDGTTGYGSVPYVFRISTYEVTNAQYLEFLNAVATSDPNEVYNGFMWQIIRTGEEGNYQYSLVYPGYEQQPVAGVEFSSAARFANWMHNGQPTGVQDATTTESGAYTLDGSNLSGSRSPTALYFLPNEDEWYKAAYYDADLQTYHDYPGGSNTPMWCREPSWVPNSANCESYESPYEATDVGAYTGSVSPYGTFDQGGNVAEWNEDKALNGWGWIRVVRGGSYQSTVDRLSSSARYSIEIDQWELGFRLATLPEPDGNLLLASGIACLLGLARWRRGAV